MFVIFHLLAELVSNTRPWLEELYWNSAQLVDFDLEKMDSEEKYAAQFGLEKEILGKNGDIDGALIAAAPLLRHVSVGPLGSPTHRPWTFCAPSQETSLALKMALYCPQGSGMLRQQYSNSIIAFI